MKKYLLFQFLLLSFFCIEGNALKPCGKGTWFVDSDKPLSEWIKSSSWYITGKVKTVKSKFEPWFNCGLEDQSKCEKRDVSKITVDVLEWKKTTFKDKPKTLILSSAYCAPGPPKQTGKTYYFFGHDLDSFIYYEKVLKSK